ncbi:hypothetical protein Rhe02_03720 [Rhizocola hellebori]|uniref:Uncharacterized protein n=1 Tax=Rhizocola hellebori TaxID=1392758 RepID=A0A8J3VD25_9ACTN|nr:hypothetical protein [Rhizocola hellebori]GIH02305.1 hypothetical protein Rhe02_03720 [Rhizocola hellebori]
MRATMMYAAGDVRVEIVPGPVLAEPTDAIVRVVRTCICGSDLHPYIDQLLPGILDGSTNPGKVFDRTVSLDQIPNGYLAMDRREALKVLVTP